MKGHHFELIKKHYKEAATDILRILKEEDLRQSFQNEHGRWRKCVTLLGDYIG